MTDIFLSYSRKDKAFAQRLFEALNEEELDAWVDWEGIPPTSDWLAEIYGGIEEADTFVFVISPDSLASEVCGWELVHAVKHNKRLIPIVAREPGKTEIVQTLASHQWVLMRENDDFDKGVETVLEAITLDLSWVKAHTRILTRALEWVKFEKNASYLLRGSDLGDGENWLARAGESVSPKPTDLQTEYILASRKQATKIQRRTLFSVAAALVLSLGLAVVALGQWQASKKNESIALTQESIAVAQQAIAVTQQAIAGEKEAEAVVAQGVAVEAQGVAEEALGVQEKQAVLIAEQARTAKAEALGAISLNLSETDSQLALLLALYGAQETAEDGLMLPGVRQALYAGIDSSLLMTYEGNTDAVFGAVISPDGQAVYAGGLDGTIRAWDIATGEMIVEFEDNGDIDKYLNFAFDISSLTISPDGRWLVSAGNLITPKSHISIWDLESMERVWFYIYRETTKVNPTKVEFNADGSLLALGFSDGVTEIYDMVGERISMSTSGTDDVFSLAFSPDGSRLAVGYFDGKIALWDTRTGELVSKITAHERGIVETLWAGSASGETEYAQGVTGLAFSPDGMQLVSTGRNPGIAMWDVASGSQLGIFEGHVGQVNDVAYHPDGSLLATVGDDSRVILWDVASFGVARILGGHFSEAVSLNFSADGTQLITGGKDGAVNLWAVVNESRLLYQLEDPHEIYQDPDKFHLSSNFNHLDVNWDGSELLSVVSLASSTQYTPTPMTLFDLSDGSIISRELPGLTRYYYQDTNLKIFNSPQQSAIFLVDTESEELETLVSDTGENGAQQFHLSPDELFLHYSPRTFTGDDLRFGAIVDLTTGEEIARSELYFGFNGAVSLGPGAVYIASVNTVYDVATEKVVAVLHDSDEYIRRFTWHVSGEYLVGVTTNNTILVWDGTTFELLHILAGHLGEIRDMAFLPNEATLVSGGEDGVLKFWDVDRGELLREIDDPTVMIVDIEVSRDGSTLVAAQEDGKIFVYLLNSDTLIEQALARLTRGDLTANECQKYLGLETCSLGWLEE